MKEPAMILPRARFARPRSSGTARIGAALTLAFACGACSSSNDDITEANDVATEEMLANRAYVISELSDELFVMDLRDMTRVGSVSTTVGAPGANANHMAMLSPDGRKAYVSATDKDAIVVVDTVRMEVIREIAVGAHPTHANDCVGCAPFGRNELWVVNEGGDHHAAEGEAAGEEREEHPPQGSISVIDMDTDEVVETLTDPSLMVPHFARFSAGRAYVPSIGGNHITVFDLETRAKVDTLVLEGMGEPSPCSADPCGFADAQIDGNGLLVAAHIETGRVIMYDTKARQRFADLSAGNRPWSVFVDNLSNVYDTHLMPNWGDSSVSILDRLERREIARSEEGDQESYGVNYSPLAPEQAFVLNRMKERVAVIDRTNGDLIESINVGGTTETASTTGDGKYLLLPLSSSNEFAVFDFATRGEVARFGDVGEYPWSVTTVGGQNYCH
jgi:YVTN family beta-propeller protein